MFFAVRGRQQRKATQTNKHAQRSNAQPRAATHSTATRSVCVYGPQGRRHGLEGVGVNKFVYPHLLLTWGFIQLNITPVAVLEVKIWGLGRG